MARRGGKAANRRDRQRKAQRRTLQHPPAPPRPTTTDGVSEAVEAAAERRVESAAAPTAAPVRTSRADPRFAVGGPSRLSERAADEYHYVRRDLRNIAVLVVVMAILLGAAVVAFSVLGIGPK
ncbi:MAG: hypothetical protein H0W81_03405 [Chloroflexi bacterium]|nr:hypothetical protein [Chloroflexota bacterium]